MDSPRSSHRPVRGPVGQAEDLFSTIKQYARQETLEPLRGAVRWLGVGTIAALSLGLALVYVSLGVLRFSQDMGGTVLDGSWSFVHYFVSLFIVAIVVVITFSRVSQRSLSKESHQ
jgi:cytochrome c biogenesis protein CcdA